MRAAYENIGDLPNSIAASEFEPVPGTEMMNIFLSGRNEKLKFYYRLEMTGTEPKGYRVSGFFKGNMKYPPSASRRPLPVKRTTGE